LSPQRRPCPPSPRQRIARFAEVHVDTPLEVCAARDTKGLYAAGATSTLPGVQAPYEAPLEPEVVVSGAGGIPADGAARVLAWLEARRWLSS
jgi:bifunctional enzyme CysN/CysC